MPLKGFTSPTSIFAHIIQPLLEARGCIQLFRLWAVGVVIWYERLLFDLDSLKCSFPSIGSAKRSTAASLSSFSVPSSLASSASSPSSPAASTSLQITILSDPQLIDSHTYDWVNQLVLPLSRFVQYLLRWASDTYAQKSYNAVVRTRGSGASKSDGVIWLGDLLDGGRRPLLSNDDVHYFEKQAKRFKGLFEEKLPSIYLPGNHDIRIPLTHNPNFEAEWKDSRSRWLEEWGVWQDVDEGRHRSTWSKKSGKEKVILFPQGGPEEVNVESNHWNQVINSRFPLYLNQSSTNSKATHEIVMIDALELAGMLPAAIASNLNFDWQREAKQRFKETYDFVESFRDIEEDDKVQRILISHIPLSRPVNSNCNLVGARHGVIRESHGAIDQGVDQYATYQNLLSSPVTNWVLDAIRPELIFSGDDHDHCEVNHAYAGGSRNARELTLKAFSMTEGVRLPGYARLALKYNAADGQSTSSYVPCLLPDQIAIWTQSYPFFLAIIFVCLMVDRKWRIGAGLDQWARIWVIKWQDWIGSYEEDDDEEWQMIEDGGAGGGGGGVSGAVDVRHYKGEDGHQSSSGEEDEREGIKRNSLHLQSPSGAKRIRFGRSSLALQPLSSSSTTIRSLTMPRIVGGTPPTSAASTASSFTASSFQARAWRELRRASKANEKVQLRNGPVQEMTKILIWPLVVWLWLQLF
ncbi:hypothetical protein CBS101457_005641 [Exobasidium rhododendri]|nr:hypothetical protein CBS101457_005641 [Exobasidium rhododendri]